MTKVFEFSGSRNECSNNKTLNLFINGGGMFTIRSPYPLIDSRTGVRSDVYYTRHGKFSLKEDGSIIDQHGGILQVKSCFGIMDAQAPRWRNEWICKQYSYSVKLEYIIKSKRTSIADIRVSGLAEIQYAWAHRKAGYEFYYTIGEIMLAQGLEQPQPAKLISGAVLNHCWTGKELSFDNWIYPQIQMGGLEVLLESDAYDTSKVQYQKPKGWSLSLWACCREEETDAIPYGISLAETEVAVEHSNRVKLSNA